MGAEDTTANDYNLTAAITINHHLHPVDPNASHSFRRRSEGDAPKRHAPLPTATANAKPSTAQPPQPLLVHHAKPPPHLNPNAPSPPARRISLDSGDSHHEPTVDLVKCRYPRCDATAPPADAKNTYKSCHNCTHMYCSRECRRAHWAKHRRACLHSRVSALCRQVLSACKDDDDTLLHLSILARRGFAVQGRGVVRMLFRSPESAEQFVRLGFQHMGEASYVRWPELMPQEMGAELYSELLRLSTEYKTETKMLIYVAICVVSEAPSSVATAGVKWERQLVSRCAKLKLSKTVLPLSHTNSEAAAGKVTATTESDGVAAPTESTATPPIDVLILTFSMAKRTGSTPEQRSLIQQNIHTALRRRGVSLRRHFPEVFQRLGTFVEGTSERMAPVTIHPRDANTGRTFICIIVPRGGGGGEHQAEADAHAAASLAKFPKGLGVEVVDCLLESIEQ